MGGTEKRLDELRRRINHQVVSTFHKVWEIDQGFIHRAILYAMERDVRNHEWIPFWNLDHFLYHRKSQYKKHENQWILAGLEARNFSSIRSIFRVIAKHGKSEHSRWTSLFDPCLMHIRGAAVPVAVKAHSMEIACQISIQFPELKDELTETLSLPTRFIETPGYLSKKRQVLQRVETKDQP